MYKFGLSVSPKKGKHATTKSRLLKEYFRDVEYFSLPETDFDITTSEYYKDADIINLHWVADFLDYRSFFKKNTKPVVWTLHDLAPFSGGIHYENVFSGIDSTGYPVVRKYLKEELQILLKLGEQKVNFMRTANNVHIIALNNWIMEKSMTSAAFAKFPHYHIANGVDKNVFSSKPAAFARQVFSIPDDKVIVLFVSDSLDNKRKGFQFLIEAIKTLEVSNLLLCAVGQLTAPIESPVPLLHLGRVDDDRLMSLLYSAADVFVIPSLEDNLPNTMVEALMCGTPVIGYAVGGIAETIVDGFNGFLSKEVSVEGLNNAFRCFVEKKSEFDRATIIGHAISKFESKCQADEYEKIYAIASGGG